MFQRQSRSKRALPFSVWVLSVLLHPIETRLAAQIGGQGRIECLDDNQPLWGTVITSMRPQPERGLSNRLWAQVKTCDKD